MASRKALKGVANNLAESFCSLMNYVDDDYVMGHIVFAAWQTAATDLRADLLTGRIESSRLLVPPVKRALAHYVEDFPGLVVRSQSDIAYVAAAELTVTVDPGNRRPHVGGPFCESPFSCSARIVDDRGKLYEHTISDWWYQERVPTLSLLTRILRTLHVPWTDEPVGMAFSVPKPNLYVSDAGFEVEVLGRVGLRYSEGDLTVFVDSEVTAVKSPTMVVWKDGIMTWESPREAVTISDSERDRIIENIRLAFASQGDQIRIQ